MPPFNEGSLALGLAYNPGISLAESHRLGLVAERLIREVPEVTEIQTFLGSVDIRLSVIARDMAHWQQIYRDRILPLPHVTDIEPLMLVATLKDSAELPL